MSNASARPARIASISVVGPGRVGRAAASAFRAAGYRVNGPTGRGEEIEPATVVLLCVSDREIPDAALAARGRAEFVGHTSGATAIEGSGVDFGIHPLRAFIGTEGADAFRGIGCAVAGTTADASGSDDTDARDARSGVFGDGAHVSLPREVDEVPTSIPHRWTPSKNGSVPETSVASERDRRL